MKIIHILSNSIIFALLSLNVFSQQNCTYNTSSYVIGKQKTVNVSEIKTDWRFQIMNLDNPFEGNKAYAEYVKSIKEEVEKRFPRKDISGSAFRENIILTQDTPIVIRGFEGNLFENSVPNDNSLAVSNNGMMVSAINSNLYFFDTQNDTLLNHVSLPAFSDTLQVSHSQYDPKLLYDPGTDKFVIVFLSGSLDSTSNIIVGFSQTNDPLGLWNLYSLSGNPLADTSWSDFPAIALTNDELFITVNLLINNEDWQTAFKQSVVWQVNKFDGFSGQSLQTKLWSDIKFGGNPIRNLNPIQGGSTLYGPDIYLISDRNFAVQNDTIFLLHISNLQTDTTAALTVDALISDKMYGMPPQAKQPQNQRFETNDARILGGFIENGVIQFVGNTVDTLTGFATFYHGIINDPADTPSVHLKIMTDTLMEYGYPNISYTGNSPTDNSAIISVNHSSSAIFPGLSAFYTDGKGNYGRRGILKTGNSMVNMLSGPDRWGDYSGSQRKYDEAGKVWVSGSFGKYYHVGINTYRLHGTWISELQKPIFGIGFNELITKNIDFTTYPNPVQDIIFVEIEIPYNSVIDISLIDISGKLVKQLMKGEATAGKNLLSFSTKPLSKGIYFLNIKDYKNIFLTKKILKE